MKVKSSNELVRVLLKHGIIVGGAERDVKEAAKLAAFAMANFGVELSGATASFDNDAYQSVDNYFGGSADKVGFYAHPLHTRMMSSDELLIEQLVSYITFEAGVTNGKRVELFKKNFPEYVRGDEVVLRNFRVVRNEEAVAALEEIAKNLLQYTRPWSIEDKEDFLAIYRFLGSASMEFGHMRAKENAIVLVKDGIYEAAKSMDYKDVVKMSADILSDFQSGHWNAPATFDMAVERHAAEYAVIGKIIDDVKPCSLTKKQAKYFNKVCAHFHKDSNHAANSPYKEATAAMKNGNVMEAARIFAANGSLLERNIVWLLSRANPRQACEILDMMKAKNPIALYQMICGISNEGKRTFQYRKHNMLTTYTESDYEEKWRKSRLNDQTVELLKKECINKIREYYSSDKMKLGKVYLSEEFRGLALPTNTSASGGGMDVLPTGSKVHVDGSFLRTFVYWKGVSDIDSAAIMVKENGEHAELSWRTYAGASRSGWYGKGVDLGESAYCSGDDRSSNGVEFQDFNIDELVAKGYRRMFMTFYAYGSRSFDVPGCEVNCGYQVIDNNKTKAWNPRNNAVNISVKGKGSSFLGFALDLVTRELVVMNLLRNTTDVVFNASEFDAVKRYTDGELLKNINMHDVISCMATEIVTDPAEADYVFDRTYVAPENTDQKVIRPMAIDALVALINR